MNATDFLSSNSYIYLPTSKNPKVALVVDNSALAQNAFKLYNPFSQKAKLFKKGGDFVKLLKVDNFDEAVLLLETIGCDKKAYQESKREVWKLDDCEVLIDEWPFLEPYLEIEGKSEEAVKAVCEKLSFDYGDALFCSADVLYSRKYGFDRDVINNQTPRICFYDENPFLN